MTQPTSREVLETAVTVLEEEGWRKNSMGGTDRAERHCALGAIERARRQLTGRDAMHPRYTDEARLLKDAMPKWYRDRNFEVVNYNDAKARKKEDVIELFQRAIKLSIIREETA